MDQRRYRQGSVEDGAEVEVWGRQQRRSVSTSILRVCVCVSVALIDPLALLAWHCLYLLVSASVSACRAEALLSAHVLSLAPCLSPVVRDCVCSHLQASTSTLSFSFSSSWLPTVAHPPQHRHIDTAKDTVPDTHTHPSTAPQTQIQAHRHADPPLSPKNKTHRQGLHFHTR